MSQAAATDRGECDGHTANVLAALALELVERMNAATRATVGLSASQTAALVTLFNYAEGQPLAILQEALGLSQPATARVLDALESRGLVTRERGQGQDGRRVRVRVTARGRRIVARAADASLEAVADVRAEISASAREAVDAPVEAMLGALTNGRSDARRICRRCEPDVCGHPERCPVTLAADRADAKAAHGGL